MKKNLTISMNNATQAFSKNLLNCSFKEEPKKQLDIMFDKFNGNCRQVICLETLEIFPSIQNLAKSLEISAKYAGIIIKNNKEYKNRHYILMDKWVVNKGRIAQNFSSKETHEIIEKRPGTSFNFYKTIGKDLSDKRVHGNSHPILCLDNFNRYPSITAVAMEITGKKTDKSAVASSIKRHGTFKGRRYIDLSKTMYFEEEIMNAGDNAIKIITDLIYEMNNYLGKKVVINQNNIFEEAKKILKK